MEIERKWLADRNRIPYDTDALDAYEIEQAYISFHPSVRVRALKDRQGNERFVLTVKSGSKAADGLVREEYELAIDREGYETLLRKAEGSVIRKTRYLFPREDGLLEEIDVFRDALEGLCYLEIEFPTVDAARAFPSPDWTQRDVTSEKRYRNSALAKYGMPTEVE
jgi:CYTH domain-containing protein